MADKPVTREEKYLAYLTGDYTGELPKPITRKEKYLYELCLKGIGGEISPEEVKAAVNEYLEKNPVKPGATTEQAQQIEQNKTDIGSLKTETGSLKEDLADVISFADDGTNPFIETNYIYSGSHTPTMVFTEDGFDLKTGGYDDPAFYFDIPVKIGHNYKLSFTVSKGTFMIIINGTKVTPDENNRVSYDGVMKNSKLTVNFTVYYSDTEYIVKNASLTDTDSTTKIILSSWYKDKKGARFGDSITAQAEFWTSGNLEGSGWSTLVKDYFGCADIVNCGVGGSTVAGTSVTNAMWTDERITAIPSDSDFILFMGGTNDWRQNIPLGTLDSDDTNTFYGALNVIAEKLGR